MHYIKSQYCDKVKCYTCQKYYPQGFINPTSNTRQFFGPTPPAGECPFGHIIEDLRHDFGCPRIETENHTIIKALEEWRTHNPSPEGHYAIIDPYEVGSFIKAEKTTVQADLNPYPESPFFMDNIECYFEDYIEQIWDINPDDEGIRIKVICDGHIDDYIIRPLTPDEYVVYLMEKHSIVRADIQWRYVMEDYRNAFTDTPEEYIACHDFPEYSMDDIVFKENIVDDCDTHWNVCALVPLAGIDNDGKPMYIKFYGNESLKDFEKIIEKEVVDVFNDVTLNN